MLLSGRLQQLRCKVAGDSSDGDLPLLRSGEDGDRMPPPRRSSRRYTRRQSLRIASPDYASRPEPRTDRALPVMPPSVKARLAELGGEAAPMTRSDFGKLIASETEKWAKVVKFAGIKPD